MSDKTDAVAQAREAYELALALISDPRSEAYNKRGIVDRAWAEVIAAVRAECADRVRGLPNWSSKHDGGPWVNRDDALAALEAK